jgi:hypothetical protein
MTNDDMGLRAQCRILAKYGQSITVKRLKTVHFGTNLGHSPITLVSPLVCLFMSLATRLVIPMPQCSFKSVTKETFRCAVLQ